MNHERPWLVLDKRVKEPNRRIRKICGPNYFFLYNGLEQRFEFWEIRGPISQMVFPVVVTGLELTRITDNEMWFATNFVREARGDRAQEQYYKNKEYKKWTAPDEYVDWRPKDNPDDWVDTSPKVSNLSN